jgi:hypothetical protein
MFVLSEHVLKEKKYTILNFITFKTLSSSETVIEHTGLKAPKL